MRKTFTVKTTLVAVIMFLITSQLHAASSTAIAPGVWSNPAIWSPVGVPGSGDDVFITGVTVNVDMNTSIIGGLTINGANGKIIINNTAVASLNVSADIVIQGTCSLENNGRFDLVSAANFTLWDGATYIHNPRANVAADESMFEFGVESFGVASNLIILKWSNTSFPLCSAVRFSNGNIGNLETSVAGIWEMNGSINGLQVFPYSSKVKGYLRVHAGTLHMDDGTGNTTFATFQDITIDGTGAIVFQDGTNRPLTVTTNSFTDNSTNNTQPTGFMSLLQNSGFGKLKWTANGNVIINHEFIGINGTISENVQPDSIIINGNLTIGGVGFTGNFNIHKQINGSLYLNVTGTTSILGNPGHVRFIDSGLGNLTFNTQNFIISGGNQNTLLGGSTALDPGGFPYPLPTGFATVNILNDFTITANSVNHIMLAPTNVQKTRVNIGRDFIQSSLLADIKVAKSIGPVSFLVGRNLTITAGYFDAQNNASSNALDSVITGNDFTFTSSNNTHYFRANSGAGGTVFRTTGDFTIGNSGTAVNEGVCGNYLGNGNLSFYVGGNFTLTLGAFRGIKDGDGNLDFTVVGALNQAGGVLKGVQNLVSGSSGITIFNLGSLNFTGGNFAQYYASNSTAVNTTCNVTGNASIIFSSVVDQFSFNSLALVGSNNNQAALKLTVGGNLTYGGVNGTFYSSLGFGPDTVNVTGNMAFNGGINSFNATHYSIYPNFHPVVINVGGNMSVSNGDNYLSAYVGELKVDIAGDLSVTGGSLTFKGDGFGNTIVNILGGYSQSNGNVYFYNNTLFPNLYDISVNVNSNDDPVGNFSHIGGTIIFDNNAASQHIRAFNIKSPTYTLDGTGYMYRAGMGTSTEFGEINFVRTGTTLFSRPTNTHSIQQTKQKVFGGTTLDLISGNIQIASHTTTGIQFFETASASTVILRLNSQIYSSATYPWSYVFIASGSRLRTQSTYGLYDGSVNAAFNSAGNLTFVLGATSTVEYFGQDNQVITGIGVGTAVGGSQKYGNLEINFTGTANGEFVYPTNVGTVNVRNILTLTAGELNLDNDHIPSNGGGRILILENSASTGIAPRVANAINPNFIRAETQDNSGKLQWNINAIITPHIVPFGYYTSGGVFYYIPVTFTGASGTSGNVTFATFHTNGFNLPYPPLVGHVNSAATGLDNSDNCVDRFWYINRTGTNSSFNLAFVLPGTTENPASAFTQLRAQHYNYTGGGWDNPFQGAQTWTAGTYTVGVTNATVVNDWWTMVNQNTPLPVSLLSFTAECKNQKQLIKWATAAEVNNERFVLEKSRDGYEYSLLTNVKGMGTTNQITNYEFTDEQPNKTLNYYRLSQVDFDGHTEQFKSIAVQGCAPDNVLAIISAHSSESNMSTIISSPDNSNYALTIMNIAGEIIYSSNVYLTQGINTVPVPSSTLANGIYVIKLNNAVGFASKNVIINH